jgi:hypothetical protein
MFYARKAGAIRVATVKPVDNGNALLIGGFQRS